MSVQITDHAVSRIRERLGVNKSAVQKLADTANESGMRHADLGGRLSRYVARQANLHGWASYRVTGDGLFVFRSNVLVTFYPFPEAHRKQAATQWRKHKSRRTQPDGEAAA